MGLYGHRFTALLYIIFSLDFRFAAALGASALVGLKTDLMIRRVRIGSKENIGWHMVGSGRVNIDFLYNYWLRSGWVGFFHISGKKFQNPSQNVVGLGKTRYFS
jgi:hypothetical protein